MPFGRADEALPLATPATPRVRSMEVAALFYIVAISAGAFGFVDLIVYGTDFESTSQSAFAQVLWPIAYLVFGLLIIARRGEVAQALRDHWWLLPFPALAALSALWSINDQASVDGAIRIAATTLIGIYLGIRFDADSLARVVFIVLLLAVGVSVAAAAASLDFAFKHDAVRGIFHHKNMLGGRGALLVAAALALLLAGWRPLLAFSGVVIGITAAIWSASASGLALAALAALVAPIVLSMRGSQSGIVLRLTAIGAFAAAAAFLLVLARVDPVAAALQLLDRDATLTGRLVLWDVAIEHIAHRPLLGAGYDAFWPAGIDWRMLGVIEDLGYVLHFHSSFVQVAVELGAVGLLTAGLYLWRYGTAAVRAVQHLRTPLWAALFGVMVLALAAVECELFMKHNLFHILFVAIPVAAQHEMARARLAMVEPGEGWLATGYARTP